MTPKRKRSLQEAIEFAVKNTVERLLMQEHGDYSYDVEMRYTDSTDKAQLDVNIRRNPPCQ